jgi:hypothetical protein
MTTPIRGAPGHRQTGQDLIRYGLRLVTVRVRYRYNPPESGLTKERL